jgi:hypothetical protein
MSFLSSGIQMRFAKNLAFKAISILSNVNGENKNIKL